jgi:hypothetical protein
MDAGFDLLLIRTRGVLLGTKLQKSAIGKTMLYLCWLRGIQDLN